MVQAVPCLCVQATIGAIVPGGAAHLDGRLQVGDEITHINGLNVMNATHREVIELMGEAGLHGEVTLSIRRKLPHADSGYPTGRYGLLLYYPLTWGRGFMLPWVLVQWAVYVWCIVCMCGISQ